jgi:hypothetical protein
MLDQREAVLKGQQIPRNHGDTGVCAGVFDGRQFT